MFSRKIKEYFAVSLVLLSFLTGLLPVTALQLPLMGVSLAALVLVLLMELVDRQARPALTREGWWCSAAVLGLGALAVLSIVVSEAPYVALVYSGVFFVFPLMFCITLRFDGRAFVRPVAAGFLVIMAGLSVITLVQYYTVTPYLADGRINWPFANPNNLAGLLSFGWFGCVAMMLAARRLRVSVGWVLLAMLIFAAMLATGSRGGLYALGGGAVVMGALLWRDVMAARWSILGLCIGCAVAILLMQYGGAESAQRPMESLGLSGEGGFLTERFEIWKAAFAMIKDHIWTGTGIGTFFLYYPEYRLADYGTAGLMAHNDILQFMAELGLLAPVLIYGLAVLVLVLSVRAYKLLAPNDARRVPLVAFVCAFAAFFVHTHITFHMHVLAIMLVLGFALGAWLCLIMDILPRARKQHVMPDAVRMGAAAALVLASALYLSHVASQAYFVRAQAYMQRGNLEHMIADLNRADQLADGRNGRAIILAATVRVAELRARGGALSEDARQPHITEIASMLGHALEVNPRLASAYYVYAQLAGLSNGANGLSDILSSEAYYLRETLRLNPQHVLARMRLADILQQDGQAQQALDVLAQGLDWPYMSADPVPYYNKTAEFALVLSASAVREKALGLAASKLQTRQQRVQQMQGLKQWAEGVRFW